MKSLKLEYHIMVTLEKVWQALVDSAVMEKWGAGPVTMSEQAGAEFKLWGGDVWGKNIEVQRGQKLVQEWRAGKWERPSLVTFTLSHKDDCTRIILEQTGIPDKEFEAIKDGWGRYYLGEIKKYLEAVK